MDLIRDETDIAEGLRQLLQMDPRLVSVAEQAGSVPLRRAEPGFTGLASIVVSQMVSRASADAIWRRMKLAGATDAAAYAALDPAAVATLGLSRAKMKTLAALSRAVLQGEVDLEGICLVAPEEAVAQLVRLPGIGSWTAHVYLMFCAGHADLFPAGDVALQAAVAKAFGWEERPSARSLGAIAEAWSPFRSVAARLFWAYYAATLRREGQPLV